MSLQQPPTMPSYPPPPPGQPLVPPQTSGLAITSLVLGIGAFFVLGISGIFAVIFGHIAMSKIKRSNGQLTGSGMALAGLICGYIGVLITIFIIGMFVLLGKFMKAEEANQREPYDLSELRIPDLPSLPTKLQTIDGSDVQVAQMKIDSGFDPGSNMQLRVYLPAAWESAALGSLPAVLVAPAGTNLLSGSSLDELSPDSYHDEALPYAEAGMVCVLYSIDGEIDEEELASDNDDDTQAEIFASYDEFNEAMAGLINSRNAFEFVTQELPKVNPEKIFAAGHSSAGTLALLYAAHEPRLAGCAVYAPCTDVAGFHQETLDTPLVGAFMVGISSFVVRSSPITHAERVQVPLFLFYSKDDEVTDIAQGREFIEALGDGADVTFETVDSGGHYMPMIEHGVPSAIKWMQGKSVE